MTTDIVYKVLWVDDLNLDEDNELTDFYEGWQLKAGKYNIELVPFDNWEEAEYSLRKDFDDYSAIILDANCKIRKNDTEQEEFITAVLPSLTKIFGEKRRVLPWYLLSAGTMSNFSKIVNGAHYQHSMHEEDWGTMLYLKDVKEGEHAPEMLFNNIARVAKDLAMNVILYRHHDAFCYLGQSKLVDSSARKLMLSMLTALYFPENYTNYVYEGNPLRKVMEYVFRAANKVGLLPQECIEHDDKINLVESNRYMSGMNTKYSQLRYGKAGNESDGRGGDTIFPEYLGHITKAIIEFGSIDSHTNEAFPYTIDDADLTLTENEKELFFSYVLQLCHVIKFFGKFVDQHRDVSANKSMKRIVGSISANTSDYEGKVFRIEQDKNGNCHCGDCILNWGEAKDQVGKQARLSNIKPNKKENTKIQYPIRASKFDLV